MTPTHTDAAASLLHTVSFTQYFYRELWGGRHQHLGLYEDPATVSLPAHKRVVQVSAWLVSPKCLPTTYSEIWEFWCHEPRKYGSPWGRCKHRW